MSSKSASSSERKASTTLRIPAKRKTTSDADSVKRARTVGGTRKPAAPARSAGVDPKDVEKLKRGVQSAHLFTQVNLYSEAARHRKLIVYARVLSKRAITTKKGLMLELSLLDREGTTIKAMVFGNKAITMHSGVREGSVYVFWRCGARASNPEWRGSFQLDYELSMSNSTSFAELSDAVLTHLAAVDKKHAKRYHIPIDCFSPISLNDVHERLESLLLKSRDASGCGTGGGSDNESDNTSDDESDNEPVKEPVNVPVEVMYLDTVGQVLAVGKQKPAGKSVKRNIVVGMPGVERNLCLDVMGTGGVYGGTLAVNTLVVIKNAKCTLYRKRPSISVGFGGASIHVYKCSKKMPTVYRQGFPDAGMEVCEDGMRRYTFDASVYRTAEVELGGCEEMTIAQAKQRSTDLQDIDDAIFFSTTVNITDTTGQSKQDEDMLWYNTCPADESHKKKMRVLDGGGYECEKCEQVYDTASKRLSLLITVKNVSVNGPAQETSGENPYTDDYDDYGQVAHGEDGSVGGDAYGDETLEIRVFDSEALVILNNLTAEQMSEKFAKMEDDPEYLGYDKAKLWATTNNRIFALNVCGRLTEYANVRSVSYTANTVRFISASPGTSAPTASSTSSSSASTVSTASAAASVEKSEPYDSDKEYADSSGDEDGEGYEDGGESD